MIEHRKNKALRKEAVKAANEKLAKKKQELLSLQKNLDTEMKEGREREKNVPKNHV